MDCYANNGHIGRDGCVSCRQLASFNSCMLWVLLDLHVHWMESLLKFKRRLLHFREIGPCSCSLDFYAMAERTLSGSLQGSGERTGTAGGFASACASARSRARIANSANVCQGYVKMLANVGSFSAVSHRFLQTTNRHPPRVKRTSVSALAYSSSSESS